MLDAMEQWLLVKRDLYWRPGDSGYTGIRDHAGCYSFDEAKARVGDGVSGVSMVKASEAPEFSKACFDDLARAHLVQQRDDLRSSLSEIREKLMGTKSPLRSIEDALVPLDHALNNL